MNEQTLQIAKDVREVIARASDYSRVNPNEVFMDMESLISSLAYLISPKIEAESAFRREVVKHIEKGESVAGAEARAKCGDAYITWKKLEALYLLAEEQIKICKKFKDNLEAEYQRM